MSTNKLPVKEKKIIILLTLGHIVTDINQGALPAALPFLVLYNDISYLAAGGLMLALTGVSSLVQPLLGYIADKSSNPQIMSIGILIASGGFAALGLASTYSAMFVCAMVSGIGIALFHPEGGRMVNCVATSGKGEAMSIFSIGGNIGFAVGPLMVALSVPFLGIKGLMITVLPAIILVLFMQRKMIDLKAYSDRHYEAKQNNLNEDKGKDNWRAFSILAVIILLDSIVDYGVITFLPLFWVAVLSQTEALSSGMLAAVTALGTVSTYIGGKMADRYGLRKVIILGSILYFPSILAISLSTKMIFAVLALMFFGLTSDIIQSPAVVLGQSYLPNHVGLSSGITLGLAVSVGGIASPLLGFIGDSHGLEISMLVLAGLGGLVALLALLIPKDIKLDK